MEVQFRPYANVNSTIRLREGRLVVRLSDLLRDAPPAVLEALALILISKLYRLRVPAGSRACYRRFLHRRQMRRRLRLVRQTRSRKPAHAPRGQVYNLERIFRRLNRGYFQGLLAMPVLRWSRHRSRTMLGHFDSAHNTIMISRRLDSPRLPRYVIEYLIYHEMLHLKYPVEYCNGRRRVHSRLFRLDERRFLHYEQARRALKELS